MFSRRRGMAHSHTRTVGRRWDGDAQEWDGLEYSIGLHLRITWITYLNKEIIGIFIVDLPPSRPLPQELLPETTCSSSCRCAARWAPQEPLPSITCRRSDPYVSALGVRCVYMVIGSRSGSLLDISSAYILTKCYDMP